MSISCTNFAVLYFHHKIQESKSPILVSSNFYGGDYFVLGYSSALKTPRHSPYTTEASSCSAILLRPSGDGLGPHMTLMM